MSEKKRVGMAETLGKEVARLRGLAKMTQPELAEAVGVSTSFIASLEVGRRLRLGADVMWSICDVLEVRCNHFMPYLAEMYKKRQRPAS